MVGVTRNAVQVRLANERFRALGLAGRVEHRVHDAHDLPALGETFTAAISVEALAEMPDLDRVLTGLREVLEPGARLVLCDVIRNEGRSPLRRAVGRVVTQVTRVLYGDRWRTADELHAALVRAGFAEVGVERIGDRVYPYTWRWARPRLGALRRTRRAGSAGLVAWANLFGLDRLYRWGEVDYAIVRARRP